MLNREYPETRTVDVVEDIHGVKIHDPYRWLENKSSKDVQDWITNQNDLALDVLNTYKGQQEIRNRLTDLFDYDTIVHGHMQIKKTQAGTRFFYLLRKSGRAQPSLVYQDNLDGKRIELLNPLELSPDGLVSLDWFYPSKDGTLVAYGLSEGGTEWSVLHIMDIQSREIFSERIPRTRACDLIWLPDNSGFYYTRYPLIGTVSPEEENYNCHLYFHKIGDNYENDVKVFWEGIKPNDQIFLETNEDCTVLGIVCFRWTSSDIYVSTVNTVNPHELHFQDMITNTDAISTLKLKGKTAFVLTQVDAPNGHIVSYDLEGLLNGGSLGDSITIVNQSESVITPSPWNYVLFGENLVVIDEKNVCNFLKVYNIATGNLIDTIEFETPMTIHRLVSEVGIDQVYFAAQSYVFPISVYYYKTKTDRGVFFNPTKKLDSDDISVKQVWCNSKDGTRVPMFLVHKKELVINANTPVLLTGYGGFAYSMTPMYGIQYIPWIERGGVVVVANLRGGMEFGQEWHRGGNRENKQNVFDDFISAAEWLIENKIGSQETLAIAGGSNGGLLVGAAMIQRSDLFKAVYCSLPLLDMVRYTGFEIAKLWTPELGDPEIKEEFQWLYSYSPYHHVSKDKSYPPIFLKTADGDSRVDPMHALKMTARLQQETKSTLTKNPIILRLESKTGHAVGAPVDKMIDQTTFYLLFLAHHAGLDLSK